MSRTIASVGSLAILLFLIAAPRAAARPSQSQSQPESQSTSQSAAVDSTFLATSSGQHLWLFTRDAKASAKLPFVLRYHSSSMGRPSIADLRHLSRRPDFFLASGDRVYFIWQRPDPATGQEVGSLQALYNASFDAYYALPQDRLETNASLPAGRIVTLTDHAAGPVVLIAPRGADNADRDIADATDTTDGANPTERKNPITQSTLLQLRSTGWVTLPLPADFDPARPAWLASDMESGRRLLLLQSATDNPTRTNVFSALNADQWSRADIKLDLSTVRSIRRVTGRAVVVQYTAGQSTCRLGFLRSDSVLWFARVPVPDAAWQIVGLHDGLQLLRTTTGGALTLSTIDPIKGTLGEAQELRSSGSRVGQVWLIAFVLAGALGVTLLVLLIRPPKEAVPPKGLEPLPVAQRLTSLAVDIFPAAVVTMLVTRCSFAELLQAPLITPKLIMSWEYLMLVGLTLFHTTVSEAIRGTTFGKALLGGRVVDYDGHRPTLRQALLRAVGKLLTLMVLPVATIALFSRLAQGLDDLLARTMVVHEQPEQPGENENQS